jgi:hypothetical protein
VVSEERRNRWRCMRARSSTSRFRRSTNIAGLARDPAERCWGLWPARQDGRQGRAGVRLARLGGILFGNDDRIRSDDAKDKNDYD